MAAATALLLSGPAQASVTTSHTHKISGNEYIAGAVFGKAALANTPTFPLRWRGLIKQRSQFTVPGGNGGKGSSATLPSRKGGLELTLTSNFAFKLLYMNKRTCYSIGQTKATLMVDGATGTGLFKDALRERLGNADLRRVPAVQERHLQYQWQPDQPARCVRRDHNQDHPADHRGASSPPLSSAAWPPAPAPPGAMSFPASL